MKIAELKIAGMTCGHCVMSVEKELKKLSDVTVEEVRIGSARLTFDESRITRSDIAKAVEEAGYVLLESI